MLGAQAAGFPATPAVGFEPTSPRRRYKLVANIKSQIKRNKTNQKAEERNRAVKSELKTAVRQAREAIAGGDRDKAQAAVKVASRKIDKAVSKGVIHKNQGANRKSAIASKASAL